LRPYRSFLAVQLQLAQLRKFLPALPCPHVSLQLTPIAILRYYTPENLPKAEDARAAAAAEQQKNSPPRQLSPAEAIAEAQAYKVITYIPFQITLLQLSSS
jgi:hypothetical protein